MLGLFLAAAAAPLSFDLICVGALSQHDLNSYSIFSKSIDTDAVKTYRVSLTDKRWCSGDCTETQEIHSIDDKDIVFKDAKGVGYEFSISVNRESGRLLYRRVSGAYAETFIGNCKPMQFSGFPKKLF